MLVFSSFLPLLIKHLGKQTLALESWHFLLINNESYFSVSCGMHASLITMDRTAKPSSSSLLLIRRFYHFGSLTQVGQTSSNLHVVFTSHVWHIEYTIFIIFNHPSLLRISLDEHQHSKNKLHPLFFLITFKKKSYSIHTWDA